MRYQVSHTTIYDYAEPVSLCHNVLHLRAREAPRQTCLSQRLAIAPEPRGLQNRSDYYGNPIVLFTIQEPHRRLSVTAEHRFEIGAACPVDVDASAPWEEVRQKLRNDRSPAILDAYRFVFTSQYVPRNQALADYAAPSLPPGRPVLEGALDLTHRIYQDYPLRQQRRRPCRRRCTRSSPTAAASARTSPILMIGCYRSLGLAARYVSGYVLTHPAPGQPRLVGADASHAWVSVYCPRIGWVDFDPTNDLIPSDQHITLAWGRDFDDVSPVKGVILGGGGHRMTVSVDVAPVETRAVAHST